MSVHPRTLMRLGARSTVEIADRHYAELEAEVTATVQGKLAARKMLVVKDDLEEAYNQAWHGVCEKIKAGEKIENLTGMLVLVTWRRAVDIYRSNHPAEHEDVDVADRGIEPDLAAEIDDREKLKRLISRLKGRLNQREREAVTLCVLHGYSRPEAAKLLNIPEPTVQKVMDGAMKKLGGIVASLSARGCGDDEWARLLHAYAFSAIEDDREYKRAAEHVANCESCRRYVRCLQGLAAVTPPAGPLVPLAAHKTSILGYLHHLFGGTHASAGAVQTGAGATTAAAGGGGVSILGGGAALKGAAAALIAAAAITATAVHVGTAHHRRPVAPHVHVAQPTASTRTFLRPPAYSPQIAGPTSSDRSAHQRRRADLVAANREFGLEAPPRTATLNPPVATQPARSPAISSAEATAAGGAEKEFSFERK